MSHLNVDYVFGHVSQNLLDFITLQLSGTSTSFQWEDWWVPILRPNTAETICRGEKNFDLMTSNYLICTKFDKVY